MREYELLWRDFHAITRQRNVKTPVSSGSQVSCSWQLATLGVQDGSGRHVRDVELWCRDMLKRLIRRFDRSLAYIVGDSLMLSCLEICDF